MNYDIIIIGGGASGLCTAINSKTKDNSILIIEHNDRVGKKILKTGNGKCNLTNMNCKASLFFKNPEGVPPYNSNLDVNFILGVLKRYDCDDTIRFFRSIGVICKEKDGYVYPVSEQAASVLDALRYQLDILGIDVETGYQPLKLWKKGGKFCIDGEYTCDKLVLATGGMASPDSGSDGSGYRLAQIFNHSVFKTHPALTGLKCDGWFYKSLKGVRTDAVVHVHLKGLNKPVCSVRGNVQFNDYGISGIPVMQVSGNIANAMSRGMEIEVKTELLPEHSFEEVVHILKEKLDSLSEDDKNMLPMEWLLNGILNKKLGAVALKDSAGLSPGKSIAESLKSFEKSGKYREGMKCGKHIDELKTISDFLCARLAGFIKHFTHIVTEPCGYDEAQVTNGGIPSDEINRETLESLRTPGLYFTGEILDADGICGGYNLQWAWSTAFIVADSLRK